MDFMNILLILNWKANQYLVFPSFFGGGRKRGFQKSEIF